MSSASSSSSDHESAGSPSSSSGHSRESSRSSSHDEQVLVRRTEGEQAGLSGALASPSQAGAVVLSGRREPDSQSCDEADEEFLSSLSGQRSTCTAEGLRELKLGKVQAIIPSPDDRPWRAPEGWFTVYEGYFACGLSFPLPGLLLDYCDKKKVALSQLAPSAINNLLTLRELGRACGAEIDLPFFEGVTSLSKVQGEPGLFYAKMKPGCGIICGSPNKIKDWKYKYFYVQKTEESLTDSQHFVRTCWNRNVGS